MRAWWMASAALAALLGGITVAGAAERARGITGAENAFNRECRYTRAYLDDERDPFLEYDFEVLHTDHAAHVASQIELREQLLGEFLDATGFRDEAEEDDAAPEGGGRTAADPGSVAVVRVPR